MGFGKSSFGTCRSHQPFGVIRLRARLSGHNEAKQPEFTGKTTICHLRHRRVALYLIPVTDGEGEAACHSYVPEKDEP